jgi:hypothetical protein
MDKRMDYEKRGKRNKFKITDKVRAKQTWVDWHSSHIAWLFAAKVEDSDEREIREQDLPSVYFLCNAKLGRKMPTGVVSRYGADDNDDNISRKNVYVTFTLDTELGDIQYSTYVAEKDLELIKKAKSRK